MDKMSMTYSGRAWKILAWTIIVLILGSVCANFIQAQEYGKPYLEARAYVECYQDGMSLDEWDISILIVNDSISNGSTYADPIYLRAEIQLDSTYWANANTWHKRELVGHEMLHVRLWKFAQPLWEMDRDRAHDLEERLVTEMSRSPMFMNWVCR